MKYARATETITIQKYTPSTYVWMMATNEFCIPMISHCMIEGFGPKRGLLDPIKVIHDDKVKERQTITIGLSLTNYLNFKGEERYYSKFNNNYLLYELK